MIQSPIIDVVVQLSVADGNEVSEISDGWTQVKQVIHMKLPMNRSVRDKALAEKGLRYWVITPTPHNKAEEGFTDDAEKVSVAFPCQK